jgi:hypothetical protein
MRRPSFRNPLFRRRRFAGEVIILCVRWYLQFKLSYRDMAEIAKELGVLVAPSTILRWVVRYAEDFSRLWRPFERPLGRSWRCDETYIKVGGSWTYLYLLSMSLAVRWHHTSAAHATRPLPKHSFARLSSNTENLGPSRWTASNQPFCATPHGDA